MRKLILLLVTIALFSCESTSTSDNIIFNQTNLLGTWNAVQYDVKNINTDTLVSTTPLSAGMFSVTFLPDGVMIRSVFGSIDTVSYTLSTFNSENIFIVAEPGNSDTDTAQVVFFNGAEMNVSEKVEDTEPGETTYDFIYMQK